MIRGDSCDFTCPDCLEPCEMFSGHIYTISYREHYHPCLRDKDYHRWDSGDVKLRKVIG